MSENENVSERIRRPSASVLSISTDLPFIAYMLRVEFVNFMRLRQACLGYEHISGFIRTRTRQILTQGCQNHQIDAAMTLQSRKTSREWNEGVTYGMLSLAIARADETTAAAPPISPRMSFIP